MDAPSNVGWLCILPPILTITLAIVSRRVIVSLLIGIASAVLILLPSPAAQQQLLGDQFSWNGYLTGSLAEFVVQFTEGHLWASLVDSDHLRVFAFTIILGMQIALIHRMRGMLGIVQWASPFARSRRGGQLMTWFLGMIVFIDDYANTLLLGSTMRPLTDRLKISREKLAFLVDSTAAPVSGLALVSTWVATEIGNMQEGYSNAGIDIGDATFSIFIQTLPTRFYILFTLAFVFLNALLNRDFGPMLAAEKRTVNESDEADGSSANSMNRAEQVNGGSSDQEHGQAINAILPIGMTVVLVIWLLVVSGQHSAGQSQLPTLGDFQAWGQIIGQGDSYLALVYGALGGLAVILLLNVFQRRISLAEIHSGLLEGFVHVLPALVILWLAWTLSGLTAENYLGTGHFLADKMSESRFSPAFLPTVIFLLSAGIAFATGTSWGTMSIVMPMAIPLVYNILKNQVGSAEIAPDHFLLTASVGSVLAGAIFGDHCSPISDTTILSSRSSHCDHIAHVRTQMPYALVIAAVAIIAGTLPAGFEVPSLVLLPLGFVGLLVILLAFGRNAEQVS